MTSRLPVHSLPAARLRAARRSLLDDGELPPGLLAPALQASWQRCRHHGLVPHGRADGAPHASGARLARTLALHQALLAPARPVMAFLGEQVRDSGSLVILADAQGMLLHTEGDARFADRASRVALRPGAVWSEQWRGTNAIGTALAELAPSVVHGAEHYLERNAFLTCAAVPIVGPCGRALGVLDISGERRGAQQHTLALVRTGARMIEQQLFAQRHGAGLQLRLHEQPEGLAAVTAALLALSEDGWIIGANGAALERLGLARTAIGAGTVERMLGIDMATLLHGAGRQRGLPRALRLPDGRTLWAQLDTGRTLLGPITAHSTTRAALPADALAALDSGDAALQALIARSRRVLDKPIALLLQGESGVGKELLARALHDSSARRSAPFVAVNCAALPDTLIEAELFGYRPGAFTGAGRDGAAGRIREADGGTLFLDEVGDMPLALQARLLRVLQERQVQPLGGGRAVAVDFRLVCATHRTLRAEVEAGRFREDLYYRLNGLTLTLPPLRERSDLAALVQRLLRELEPARELALAPPLQAAFAAYRWPGNLRQLASALRTACALLDDEEALITEAHLPEDLLAELSGPAMQAPATDEEASEEATDLRSLAGRCVQQALRRSDGNLSEAARCLGVSRNTLYRKLRALRSPAALQ